MGGNYLRIELHVIQDLLSPDPLQDEPPLRAVLLQPVQDRCALRRHLEDKVVEHLALREVVVVRLEAYEEGREALHELDMIKKARMGIDKVTRYFWWSSSSMSCFSKILSGQTKAEYSN